MNIIFLSKRFHPDTGGVEKHVSEVSKILVEMGHNVTVITESKGHTNKLSGVEIIRLKNLPNSWFKKFYIWRWMVQNIDLFKKSDIVHAHDVYFWYFPLAFLLPFKKSFVTFHGYESFPISKKAIVVRKVSEIISKGNICVGNFMRKWYYASPDRVIYGGVNLPDHLSSPKNKESAVFIGRLDEQTGVLDYAKSVDKINEIYPDFKFTILGEGKYFEKLRKYRPLGFKQNTDLFLTESNFAFVSRYLSILEAFSQKRLVIAHFDNPLKEDYLKMTPFSSLIITSSSPEEIFQKTNYFLKNSKEANDLTEKAYNWVKNRSWEKIAQIYLDLWREK